MKIVHVLSQTQLTGSEVYAAVIAKEQVQQGHNVTFISEQIHVPLPCPFISLPLTSKNRKIRKQNQKFLHQFLLENKIDIIHCHSREAVRNMHIARKKTNCALITSLHMQDHISLSKRLFDIYGECLIAISEAIKTYHCKNFWTSTNKVFVIPNPVTPLSNKPTFLEKDKETKKEFRLALVSRSTGPKGRRAMQFFEQVAVPLLQDFPQLQLSFICNNLSYFPKSFLQKLQQLQSQFPSRLKIFSELVGIQEHLLQYHTVISSGRVAMEALLEEIPVIALGEDDFIGCVNQFTLQECFTTNFGDMSLTNQKENPIDSSKIYGEIRRTIRDYPLVCEQTKTIKPQVEKRYHTKYVTKQIMEIYQLALEKKGEKKFGFWKFSSSFFERS